MLHMAKTKKEEKVEVVDVKLSLKNLLKEETPAIFDREPQSGFAEGNLNKLVEDIVNLFN